MISGCLFATPGTENIFPDSVYHDYKVNDETFAVVKIETNRSTFVLFCTNPGAPDLSKFKLNKFVSDSFVTRVDNLHRVQSRYSDYSSSEIYQLDQKNINLRLHLRKIQDFYTKMSHEIRTPLNSIIGLSEMIKDSDDHAENRKCMEVISRSSVMLLSIVNDILDLSKLKSSTVKLEKIPFNLYQEIKNLFEMYQCQMDFQVELLLDYQLEKQQNYEGDVARIRQVLTNIISNAKKFTEQGYIKITVTQPRPEYITIAIADTGMGVADENKVTLFRDFKQADASVSRKFGGTGLGLSICKNIIDLMGGNIWIEDNKEAGRGSVFIIKFKLSHYKHAIKATKPQCLENIEDMRVMVVDDTSMNLFLMKKVFSTTRMKVSYFESGEDSIEAFKKENYDCVLMDLQMPGLSGQETTQQLRKIEMDQKMQPTKIFALTADIYQSQEKLSEFGFDGIFTKPLDKNKLFKVLKGN